MKKLNKSYLYICIYMYVTDIVRFGDISFLTNSKQWCKRIGPKHGT